MEKRFYGEYKATYNVTSRRFDEERRADAVATKAIVERLATLELMNSDEADRIQNLIIENLYALALVEWYRHLVRFADYYCSPILGVTEKVGEQLNLCMGTSRDAYVAASRVFGLEHPILMLRALQSIREIISARVPEEKRRISIAREEFESMSSKEALRQYRVVQDMQRYGLLTATMDTPFKFALVGCATGWFKERDKRHGSQLLFMEFYPIEDQVQWMLTGHTGGRARSNYSGFFTNALQVIDGQQSVNNLKHPLFSVRDKGNVDLPKGSASTNLSFSCSFHRSERGRTDQVEEGKTCVKRLGSDWARFLESQNYELEVVSDDSMPGWLRIVTAVSKAGKRQFRYFLESEVNGHETMGYATITILEK